MAEFPSRMDKYVNPPNRVWNRMAAAQRAMEAVKDPMFVDADEEWTCFFCRTILAHTRNCPYVAWKKLVDD